MSVLSGGVLVSSGGGDSVDKEVDTNTNDALGAPEGKGGPVMAIHAWL